MGKLPPSVIWRKASAAAAAAPSRISPLLMLPPSASGNKLYSLASNKVLSFKKEPASPLPSAGEGRVKVVGSSHGWVATYNCDTKHLHLSDPISGRHMELPDMPESFFCPLISGKIANKVILTNTPAVKNCLALMEYGRNRIALCRRPGRRGSAWTTFGDGFYRDMVYSPRWKCLFAITSDEDVVEVWNMADPASPKREWATDLDLTSYAAWVEEGPTRSEEEMEGRPCPPEIGWRDDTYLVFAEESSQLFLLRRYIDGRPYRTFAFDVYEVYWKGWRHGRRARKYVDGSLGGLAMFVGTNHAVAMRATAEVKADSIYFTDEWEDDVGWEIDVGRSLEYGGHDIGVYDYKQRTLSSVYYPSQPSLFTKVSPPPFWLTPTSLVTN